MDEMNKNQDLDYTKQDLLLMMEIIKDNYPDLFNSVKEDVKPTLTDFNKIPDVIYFVEVEEDIMGSFLFMPYKEKMEFLKLAIAVIVLLYAPAYFSVFKQRQTNLPNGLRAAIAKCLGYEDRSHSSISDHIKTIRGYFDVLPFFKNRAYKLADEYRKKITNQD